MKLILLLLLLAASCCALAQEQRRGTVEGRVIDGRTQEPLPGVNILLVGTSYGASTDASGVFTLKGIPVGEYSLRASLLGYQTVVVTNTVVTTGRSTKVAVSLQETAIQVTETKVSADYFRRAASLSPLSASTLDGAEMKRSPGSLMDIQRVVQILPGIGNSSDNLNELLVRGGAAHENLTVMDYMEIPSINHYANQFNSSGPINILNMDMVEDMQFSSGGFPAQYGDKMSSVMNISLREGDRQNPFKSNSGLNMAGFNTLMEGGFAGGRGAWIISVRKSMLEVLDNVIGMSSLSLTAVPRYWDAQAKIVYDLSPAQKLILNGLYGSSKIYIKGEYDAHDDIRRNVRDTSDVVTIDNKNSQFAAGLSLKSLWGREGYSVLTLSVIGNRYGVVIPEELVARRYDANGDVPEYKVLGTRTSVDADSYESFFAAKYELYYQLHPAHRVSAGVQAQTVNRWDNNVAVMPDTARYDLNRDGVFEVPMVTFPGVSYKKSMRFGDATKSYAHVSDQIALAQGLSLTLGVRADYFDYARRGSISPRTSLSWQMNPVTSLTLAWGDYFQTQPFPYFSDNRDLGYNRTLPPAHARHYAAGIEHIIDEGLRVTVEGYYKDYSNIVVEDRFIHSADKTYRSDTNRAIGRKRSYGVEFFIQQKQVGAFFATASLSLSRTEFADPRMPPLTAWFTDEHDYPVIAVVSAGTLVKGTRSALDDLPFYLKYPSYILPLSDDMELSAKFRYQSGKPYTPMQYVAWEQHRQGGAQWTSGAWEMSDRINEERYPAYHRLDVQWISRFHYESWSMHVYVTLQNIYNRKNVFYDVYRSDGTIERVSQLSFFPVAGIEILF